MAILSKGSTDLEHGGQVLKGNALGSRDYPSAALLLHCGILKRPNLRYLEEL